MIRLLFFVVGLIFLMNTPSALAKSSSKPTSKSSSKPGSKDSPRESFVVGTIVNNQAIVYDSANFDARQIRYLESGKRYRVSQKVYGPFYKIQIARGKYGYIADSDVMVKNKATRGSSNKTEKTVQALEPFGESKKKKKPKSKVDRRPFIIRTHQGFGLNYVQYKEDTLGDVQKADMLWLSYQISGPQGLMEMADADGGLTLGFSAPDYYKNITENPARGFIFMFHLVPQFTYAQSRRNYTYFGVGPFFKFSHFETKLNIGNTGSQKSYNLDDMTLGLLTQVGMALQIGDRFSTRLEGRYFWDRQSYYGLSFIFQFPFSHEDTPAASKPD